MGALRTSLGLSKKDQQRPQTSALTAMISPFELNRPGDTSMFLSPGKVVNEVDDLLLTSPKSRSIINSSVSLDRTD